jgi:hypothetical protein
VARASNTILKYSLESDDVVVDLGCDSVPWCDVKKGLDEPAEFRRARPAPRGLPLRQREGPAHLGKAGPQSLFRLGRDARLYHTMRIREDVRIPEIENLMAKQADGTLETYAVDAVRRSTEKLRKTYGQPDASRGRS